MGNSNGTLAEYWDAIETTPGLQGGFIWEWWDHGLVQQLPDGGTRWAYGGDFGDEPNDGSFCADGLVWPDGTPKPALREAQFLNAPVRLAAGESPAHVRLRNRQHRRDLGWLRGHWELVGEGGILARGALEATDVAPGAEADVALLGWPDAPPDDGQWLTVRFETAARGPWAEAGFEVCWDQLELLEGSDALEPDARISSEHPGLGSASGVASGEPAPIELDAEGDLIHPLLARAPRLALWRAPTENDRYGGMVEVRDGVTTVRREVRVGRSIVPHRQSMTAAPGGRIHVVEEAVIPADLSDLPRVGTVLEIVPGLERAEWFGRGPHESYPDRKRSAMVGRWRGRVGDLFVPYIRPQESGGRADVRWLELRDAERRGIRLTLDQPRQVSASHFRASDLDAARHHGELVARPEVIVHLDAAHRGLGTASCGPDTLERYLLGPGTYRWEWTLQAL
jgi:beta-galactosidase